MNRIFYLFIFLCCLSYGVWGQNAKNYSLNDLPVLAQSVLVAHQMYQPSSRRPGG